MTSVLLVGGCTSVVAGVIHWVQVTATGLWTAACLGVATATDCCTVGAVAAYCTASEVDGLSSHFNLGVHVMGSRLLLYRKNMWLRMMCCLQIIWQENRKFQQRSWSTTILHREDMVQAGCD